MRTKATLACVAPALICSANAPARQPGQDVRLAQNAYPSFFKE